MVSRNLFQELPFYRNNISEYTVGHKSRDPCYHVFLKEAKGHDFCDPLYIEKTSLCLKYDGKTREERKLVIFKDT